MESLNPSWVEKPSERLNIVQFSYMTKMGFMLLSSKLATLLSFVKTDLCTFCERHTQMSVNTDGGLLNH